MSPGRDEKDKVRFVVFSSNAQVTFVFFEQGDIIGTDGHDFPILGRLVGRCPLVSVVGLDIKIVASVVRRSILLFEVEVDARRINVERK